MIYSTFAPILATDLNLSPLAIGAILFSGISFIIMFGIASAKGGFQELVDTTLKNDQLVRKSRESQNN